MIQISIPNGKIIRSIPNDDFFDHISAGELVEDHPEFNKANSRWSFVIFPPKRVADLYFKLKKESVTPVISQAYGQQFGLIEVCRGDYDNPTWIPITLDLNVGMLKKDWYYAYCRAHGYTIMESDEVVVKGEDKREGFL